jgi:hypothetical protein
VQEYARGGDVLTVALSQQIASEGDFTMAMVMDVPMPPKSQAIVAFPSLLVETAEAPDAALAWYVKELAARGWSAGRQSTAGTARSASFTKSGRSLQAIVSPLGGGKTGATVQLMHTAAAE